MIQPIGDRLLVKPNSSEEKSKGGILLSKREEDKQDQGIVVSVGDGENVKQFKIGDNLIYQKYGPAEINIEKIKFVIVNLDEILAIIKKGEKNV